MRGPWRSRIAAALLSVAILSAQSKLLPVDESASDPQFSKFYHSFRTAIARKDAKFLTGVLDPEVGIDLGGETGQQAFEKYWNPSDPKSKLWTELATITALGGSFSTEGGTKTFCAPYTYSKFPDALDAFDHGVIIGPGVELRAKPASTGTVIAKLAYEIVKVPSWDPQETAQWVRVTSRAGNGYVRREEIRSPTGFRACFARKKGQWTLRWLIAGD